MKTAKRLLIAAIVANVTVLYGPSPAATGEQAWDPVPVDRAENIDGDPNVVLRWQMGDVDPLLEIDYYVYYGTNLGAVESGTSSMEHTETTSIAIGPLAGGRVHYWRVDTRLYLSRPPFTAIIIPGEVWQFTTLADEPAGGLVGHWKFDEGQGSVAHDSAGSNDGVIHGAVWVDGVLGSALDFGGDQDHVEIPDDDVLTPSSEMTVSWWVQVRGDQGANIRKYAFCPSEPSSPGNSRAYALGLSRRGMGLVIASGTSSFSDLSYEASISTNEWHHEVGTFDRGDAALYLDGVLVASDTLSTTSIINDVHPLIVGGCWSYCGADHFVDYLDGLADDVRLYDRALSADEVVELYGTEPDDGLVAHWKFDEGDWVIAYDSAGSNDGVVYGAQWIDGVLGGALDFDGVDDYIDAGDPVSAADELTVSAWVKSSVSGNDEQLHRIASRWAGHTHHSFILGYDGRGTPVFEFAVYTDSIVEAEAVHTANPGQWYFIVGTYDGSQQKVYIDGVEAANVPNSGPIAFSGGIRTKIARDDDSVNQHYFNGAIDDVRIYERALSAGEIGELYDEVPRADGLVSHWRFDEGGGSVASDSAGSNDGVVHGAAWVDGVLEGALSFDGANDYVEVADDPSMRVNQNSRFSISVWAKPSPGGHVLSKLRAGGRRGVFGFYMAAGLTSYGISIDDSYGAWTDVRTASERPGDWEYVTAVYDNREIKLYLNGVLRNSGYFSRDTGDKEPDKHFIVGGISYDDVIAHYYQGAVDDVRFYGRALSDAEVLALYGDVPEPPESEVYHVDGDGGSDFNDGLSRGTAFATIEKGIDSSADGGRVLVWPGVYSGRVDFDGKAITVKSEADAAVIETAGQDAVSFGSGEGPGSVLSNFVIRGSATAIVVNNQSSPTLRNLTVADNDFGIIAQGQSYPDISDCILWDNRDGDLSGCAARHSFVQQEIEGDSDEGMVGHWKFDEGAGMIAYDSAGSNDGVVYGAQWVDGMLGGALDFDGVDNYVQVEDADSLTPSNIMTISYWVQIEAEAEAGAGVYKLATCPDQSASPGNSRAYNLSVGGPGNNVYFKIHSQPRTFGELISVSEVLPDQWHHISATFDSGQAAIYVNGQLDRSTTMPVGSIMNDVQPLTIGGYWSYCGTDYFEDRSGIMDDVRIYDRALSAGEIELLYNGGLSGEDDVDTLRPLFAGGGDYHLLSERGRYWPAQDIWVLDKVSSPCIDAGDPSIEPSGEPMPNGGLLNIGAYGGTGYASMSEWPILSDYDRSGRSDFSDFTVLCDEWLLLLPWAE